MTLGLGGRLGRDRARMRPCAARRPTSPARTRRARTASAIMLAVVGVGLAGCAGLPGLGPRSVPPEQQAAYDSAMGRLPGDPAGAAQALEQFIEIHPNSLLADDAAEQRAQIALDAGREELAEEWLRRILSRYPQSDRAAPARLRLAQIEFARDDRSAARRLLAPLVLDRLPLPERRAALRLRVVLAQTPLERLEQLAALREVLARESEQTPAAGEARARVDRRRTQVDRELAELVASAATTELEAMVDTLRRRPPSAEVTLELARRAVGTGRLERAEDWLDALDRYDLTPTQQAEVERLRERRTRAVEIAEVQADLPALADLVGRPRPSVDDARGTLGVVLPLTGEFAEFGQASLRGILLATDLFAGSGGAGSGGAGSGGSGDPNVDFGSRKEIRLQVRDSRGDPSRAARLVHELARDASTVAIIGPIFSQESIAAADAAETEGIPLVALSPRDDVPEHRANAFRTKTTPQDEVGVLVGHAFEQLGAQRFAVLYPRTRFGRGMRKLFWDAVTERGGKIVAASSYEPDAVDFSDAIRDMIGYRFLTARERRALDERTRLLRDARRMDRRDAAKLRRAAYALAGPEGDPLPPIVDFDVLFIPDAAEKIALIAPGLAFHEIRGVTLLGSSDWLDEELLRVARRHVRGAVISSPFAPGSALPFVTEFVEGYRNTFGAEPDANAAEAYDATNLVLVQLAAGRRDREDVRRGLLDMRAYPGASGVLTMNPDGNAHRRPFLIRVEQGAFQPLD